MDGRELLIDGIARCLLGIVCLMAFRFFASFSTIESTGSRRPLFELLPLRTGFSVGCLIADGHSRLGQRNGLAKRYVLINELIGLSGCCETLIDCLWKGMSGLWLLNPIV